MLEKSLTPAATYRYPWLPATHKRIWLRYYGPFEYQSTWIEKKNTKSKIWRIIAYTKFVLSILFHQSAFINSRIFFIQIIFIYKLGKWLNIAGVNHYRCCAIRDIIWSHISPRFKKKVTAIELFCKNSKNYKLFIGCNPSLQYLAGELLSFSL